MTRAFVTDSSKEILINEIQQHPNLWDTALDTYHVKDARDKSWEKIALNCGCGAEECKQQWKYIKEKFRRQDAKMRQEQSNSSADGSNHWPLMDVLHFIRPFVKPMEASPKYRAANFGDKESESSGKDLSSTISDDLASNQSNDVVEPYPRFVMTVPEAQATSSYSLKDVKPIPYERRGIKRNYSTNEIQITSVSSETSKELKRVEQMVENTRNSIHSFYRNMADEALKLPDLQRLKLQVSVLQLHIDAMEKCQNANQSN